MTASPDDAPETPPFGQQLYEGMRRAGLMGLLTRHLDYAEIQELKRAERAGVVRLFPGAPYAMRQRFKTESAEQIVEVLVRELEKSEVAMLILLFALT